MQDVKSGSSMKRSEVVKFSQWLASNPGGKYKRSSAVVKAFFEFKKRIGSELSERNMGGMQ